MFTFQDFHLFDSTMTETVREVQIPPGSEILRVQIPSGATLTVKGKMRDAADYEDVKGLDGSYAFVDAADSAGMYYFDVTGLDRIEATIDTAGTLVSASFLGEVK